MIKVQKFGRFVTKNRIGIIIVAFLLLIPSFIGLKNTEVNYDLLSYLPSDLMSVKGETILDKDFSYAATGMLVIKGMPDSKVVNLKKEIQKVNGVESVIWRDDIANITVPSKILPDSLTEIFDKRNTTLMLIQFKNGSASKTTQDAISAIRSKMDNRCYLSGTSAINKDTVDLINSEFPKYVILAVVIALLVMGLTMESTVVPLLFLTSIGLAIMYNLGSNIIFGEISYITKALAAVLQIGVTMDFAIFLYNRYEHELKKIGDKNQAMISAMKNSFTAVFGSGCATSCGFLVLAVMRLGLGRDIGFVMAKGIVLSMISTFTILPALLLTFSNAIEKYRHPTILPSFKKLAKFIVDKRVVIIVIAVIIFIPAFIGQKNAKVYYNLSDRLPDSMPSKQALTVLKKDYNMATTHFIIVKSSTPAYELSEMENRISKLDGITKVLGVDKFIGPGIPKSILPSAIKDIFIQNGYQMIEVNSSYKTASDALGTQLSKINSIVKEYDKSAYVTGEGALTNDLIDITSIDFKNVDMFSILVVFAIVLILFTSVSIPLLLVITIELAIFINMGIPYYTGNSIPFIASIVIGCIQLAATVDYAILLTSSYREHIRRGDDKYKSMRLAVQHSTKSIITSGLTLSGATLGICLIAKMDLLRSLTLLISRGALISLLTIIFILPPVLLLCNGFIEKTSLFWRHSHSGKVVSDDDDEN